MHTEDALVVGVDPAGDRCAAVQVVPVKRVVLVHLIHRAVHAPGGPLQTPRYQELSRPHPAAGRHRQPVDGPQDHVVPGPPDVEDLGIGPRGHQDLARGGIVARHPAGTREHAGQEPPVATSKRQQLGASTDHEPLAVRVDVDQRLRLTGTRRRHGLGDFGSTMGGTADPDVTVGEGPLIADELTRSGPETPADACDGGSASPYSAGTGTHAVPSNGTVVIGVAPSVDVVEVATLEVGGGSPVRPRSTATGARRRDGPPRRRSTRWCTRPSSPAGRRHSRPGHPSAQRTWSVPRHERATEPTRRTRDGRFAADRPGWYRSPPTRNPSCEHLPTPRPARHPQGLRPGARRPWPRRGSPGTTGSSWHPTWCPVRSARSMTPSRCTTPT